MGSDVMPQIESTGSIKSYFVLQPGDQSPVLTEGVLDEKAHGKALKTLRDIREHQADPFLLVKKSGGIEGVVKEIVARYEGKLGLCDKVWQRLLGLFGVETVQRLARDIFRKEKELPRYIPACQAIWHRLQLEQELGVPNGKRVPKEPGWLRGHLNALQEGEASEEKDAILKAVIEKLMFHRGKVVRLLFVKFHNPQVARACQEMVAGWFGCRIAPKEVQWHAKPSQVRALDKIRKAAMDADISAEVDCLKNGEASFGRDHGLRWTILGWHLKNMDSKNPVYLERAVELLKIPFCDPVLFTQSYDIVEELAEDLGATIPQISRAVPPVEEPPVYTPQHFVGRLMSMERCSAAIELAKGCPEFQHEIKFLKLGRCAARKKWDKLVDRLIALEKVKRKRALEWVLTVFGPPLYMQGAPLSLRLIEELTSNQAYDAALKVEACFLKNRTVRAGIESAQRRHVSYYGDSYYEHGYYRPRN